MKEIKLTQGRTTKIDNEDFKFLNKYKWHAQKKIRKDKTIYYAVRGINNKTKNIKIYMHREIIKQKLIREKNINLFVDFLSNPLKFQVDHINHDTLDNQKHNLRIVSPRENQQNRNDPRTSEYPGVTYDKKSGKWRAHIFINGKLKSLKYHNTEEEAYKSYKEASNNLI